MSDFHWKRNFFVDEQHLREYQGVLNYRGLALIWCSLEKLMLKEVIQLERHFATKSVFVRLNQHSRLISGLTSVEMEVSIWVRKKMYIY